VAGTTNPDGIGFTGHVNDPDTGLVYMQQRYYDPVAGRFLSVDPVTTDAKDGTSFNRYVYGNSNPYKYTDPDGRYSLSWESVPGFGGGVTVGYDARTTELAITVNLGAGLSGGTMVDLRPGENGRAPLANGTQAGVAGLAVNSYGKAGAELRTPVGTAAVGAKVTAGKDLTTGGTVGGLSRESGFSRDTGAGLRAGKSGGVEVSAYVNVSGAAQSAGQAAGQAISSTSNAFFSSNFGKGLWNAMQIAPVDPNR
jgi:RHS repeat-associated protein